jgi:tetratricopeptide (TPR) repeat protein
MLVGSPSPPASADADSGQALPPRLVRAYGLARRSRIEEAEALCREELASDPGSIEATFLLSALLLLSGRAGEGADVLKAGFARNSGAIGVQVKPGTLTLSRRPAAATVIAERERAVAAAPEKPDALHRLGLALVEARQHARAITSFVRAIELQPDFMPARQALCAALIETERFEEALEWARGGLALQPDNVGLLANQAFALGQLGHPEEALPVIERAVALQPGDVHLRVALANVLLRLGRYKDGFREHEHRWRRPVNLSERPGIAAPVWAGEPLRGKSILVHNEIGFGDAIQFVRFLPLLAERDPRITLLAPPRLLRLLKPFARFAELVGSVDLAATFDFQCGLMSLPHWLGIDLDTLPRAVPYLAAEPDRVARWRQRIAGPGLKVGITWQGNPRWTIDKARSVPLRHFQPLAGVAGVRLISLQVEHGLDQLQRLPAGMKVELLGPEFNAGADAFLDTAAVMECLDLVISSDTANAHLAGALGRPVWVALNSASDWRWLVRRTDSPWYPTMRLFRQHQRGAWEQPFSEMAAELGRWPR